MQNQAAGNRSPFHTGRHFLQIPGPTNVPDRVLRAMDKPTIDHRGPEFARLGLEILDGCKRGIPDQGADRHLRSLGHRRLGGRARQHAVAGRPRAHVRDRPFRDTLADMAEKLGLVVDFVPGDWRRGASPGGDEGLAEDRAHTYKAVMAVHNETSTGVTSRIAAVRQAIDRAASGAVHGRHHLFARLDRLPARRMGCGRDGRRLAKRPHAAARARFNAVSDKALAASKAKLPRSYWRWDETIAMNRQGYFPSTPATNLLYGLHEALAMLHEEGLGGVRAPPRHAEATRARCARGASRSCARSRRVQRFADRGHDARRP